MNNFYKTLVNQDNVYGEMLIQLSAFTPTPTFLSTNIVVNTTLDTITSSGTGTGSYRAIKINYTITPESGFTGIPYSIGVNNPSYDFPPEELINVTGTNTKFIYNTDESDGGFSIQCTGDGSYSFYIKSKVGFQFRISFTIEYYFSLGLGSAYILQETYTSPTTSIQTIV